MTELASATDPILDEIVRRTLVRLAPDQIILFGSRARGDAHPDSDYDVIFVIEPSPDGTSREKDLQDVFRGRSWKMDVLVTTPEAFEWRRRDIGTLEYVVEQEGRVLYRRPDTRAAARVREEPLGEPRSVTEWIDRARGDFWILEASLSADNPPADPVCFHAHQGVEKVLKAVLVKSGTPPPHRHALASLLSLCPASLQKVQGVADACTLLDGVFPKTRYPPHPRPTVDEMADAVRAARGVREAVRIVDVQV
jgi:predicted nucleotidyltransferase/HEPN domain-containing protein